MKNWIKGVMAVGLASMSLSAMAGLVDLTLVPPHLLNPGTPDTGVFFEQACPTPQACPTAGNFITGHDNILFDVIGTNGIMNISIIGSVTPSTGGTFAFAYTVFNPALIPISTGTGPIASQLPPDFAIAIGAGYLISLDWTLTSTGPINSASFSLNATTGPALRVPEPATLALLGLGLAGLGFMRRRQS